MEDYDKDLIPAEVIETPTHPLQPVIHVTRLLMACAKKIAEVVEIMHYPVVHVSAPMVKV
jgi:hypothetical protein